MAKTYWVGFDLGGTKMMATLYDERFRKQGAARKKTKGNEGVEAGLQRIIRTITDSQQSAGLEPASVAGIGVGAPGLLDLDRGIILDTPNMGWRNVPLKATLEKHFKCPVVIANDVDAGTYGEYRFGAGKKGRCVLGVFPGTGVGAGCVYEGRIIRGRTGSCMELGHFPVDMRGPVADVGRYGTLESMTSRLAISAQAAQAVYRGQAPALKELAGTRLDRIKSGALATAIEQGDRVVEEIVRHAARVLGGTVAGVVNLLAPDVLVLGGGLVEALPRLYKQEVTAAIKANAMPPFAAGVSVAVAKLGDDAVVCGAAALAADAHT